MIKKFHAATTRDALRQVRDALGANAIILSNRQVAGGIEIIAVADMDMAALAAQAEPAREAPRTAAPPPPQPQQPLWRDSTRPAPSAPVYSTPDWPAAAPMPTLEEARPHIASLAEYLAQREASLIKPSPARQAARAAQATPRPAPETVTASPRPSPSPHAPAEPVAAPEAVEALAREMRLLRGLVEGQLAGFAWNDLSRRDPRRAEAMKRLLAAGFSPAFSRMLLDRLPEEEAELTQAMKWLKSTIAHNLKVADSDADIIERGGVYALVGPTGVGKTTTVAKLAARAVLRHGAAKVALITTDTYRIGAQDQLRIYGRILGTQVFAVRDENDLELTLSDLANRHLVFIDTVGMSQRDKRVAEQGVCCAATTARSVVCSCWARPARG